MVHQWKNQLPPPLEIDNPIYVNTDRSILVAKTKSATTFFDKRIFLIKSASSGMKIPSIISWFQLLVSGFIKQSTVASSIDSKIGEVIFGWCFIGNHQFCQILMDLPSPTRQKAPLRITSLPLIILFHAYEPAIDSFASKIEQCGKNFALKTL